MNGGRIPLSLLSSILLGLIQGLAEFLPISSSGHLAIAAHFMGQAGIGEPPPFFDVLLHLGTLAAVFAAYWQDIREMIVELICGVRDLARGTTPSPIPPARRLILLIIVGTLPLFVVLPVKDFIEGLGDNIYIVATLPLFAVLPIKDWIEGLSSNIYFVAGALIVTGFLLFACDRVKKGRKTEKSATLVDVLLVGVAQAIATCPGISRSGTTITAGCFVGLDRKFAVRYSFLMSIPAILGANLLTLKDAIAEKTIIVSDIPVYLVGVAVAAVVGYLCIRLLKMIADKGRFGWFAYYCWAAGVIVLALAVVLG